MSQGIFYVLDDLTEQQQLTLFCDQITQRWREFRSVRVWCESQQQAEQLDEALWQQPADAFVPHNLAGEGPPQGAPVELCWPGVKVASRRTAVVVNLMNEIPFHQGARLIVERVPSAESERQLARERYRTYRHHGFELQTIKAIDVLPNN
jgi:DNA polymerase III subunit chi